MSMHTPWGKADHQKKYGSGSASIYVMFYSTPSHGGFLVTDDMRARMPAALREIKTWAGRNSIGTWYEEDCDWAIVALAFPYLFDPEQILAAVETANRVWDKKEGPAAPEAYAWLRSAEGAAVCEIAARYEAANFGKFRMGSEWTAGSGWQANARNIAGDVEISIEFPGESRYKMPPGAFTELDIARAGGRIIGKRACDSTGPLPS